MTFSNPLNAAAANAQTYIASLLDLLGDLDPVSVQESLVDEVERAVAGLDDAALRRPEAPGKWSVLQVVQHLADTELVYGFRMRMILAHDVPEIQAYDQDTWTDRLRYNEVALADALAQLRVMRCANLRLVRSLSDRELDRFGIHEERGEESVRRIVQLIAAHDLVHRRQIERIKGG